MSGMVFLNDIDVAEFGVVVDQFPAGHRDQPEVTPPGSPVLGLVGFIDTSGSTSGQPRRATIEGVQIADTREALITALDGLKRLCHSGFVRLRYGDMPDRELEAICRVVASPISDWMNESRQNVSISVHAPDPVFESRVPENVDFSGGATPCPVGSAIVEPLIRIGEVTDPVITVRDYLGREVLTMGIVATLGAGQFLEIDCEQKTIVDQAGTPQAPVLASGDFLQLVPADAAALGGPYGTIECTGSPGIAEAIYRRRWL